MQGCLSLYSSRRLRRVSPLAAQPTLQPSRGCTLDRFGLATRRMSFPRIPLCRSASASSPDDNDEAARVAGEVYVEKLRSSMSQEDLNVVSSLPAAGQLRSTSAVWEVAVALCMLAGVTLAEWQRSEEGIRCALAVCGYVLVPGSVGEPPVCSDGSARNGRRKVVFWRDGARSKQSELNDLLRGKQKLLSSEERDVINANKSTLLKAKLSGGAATTNERKAAHLDAFWTLADLHDVL